MLRKQGDNEANTSSALLSARKMLPELNRVVDIYTVISVSASELLHFLIFLMTSANLDKKCKTAVADGNLI